MKWSDAEKTANNARDNFLPHPIDTSKRSSLARKKTQNKTIKLPIHDSHRELTQLLQRQLKRYVTDYLHREPQKTHSFHRDNSANSALHLSKQFRHYNTPGNAT